MVGGVILCRETGRSLSGLNETKQDPMGPSPDRPLPHILCFSSSLKDSGENST